MKNEYPCEAGAKVEGASRLAAQAVDRDPERRHRAGVYLAMAAVLDTDNCADDLAVLIDECILYTRPRVSELINMGVLVKSVRTKRSPLYGRTAHIIDASADLLREIGRCRPDDLHSLERVISAFITTRQIEAAQVRRQTRNGPEIYALVDKTKPPRSRPTPGAESRAAR